MDITKLSITELKAMAYDILAQLENLQRNLKIVNDEIAVKSQQPPIPTVAEEKKEEPKEEIPEEDVEIS